MSASKDRKLLNWVKPSFEKLELASLQKVRSFLTQMKELSMME